MSEAKPEFELPLLYFYVDGADLEAVAPSMRGRVEAFIEGRTWASTDVWFVDQRYSPEPDARPGELPV